jgi:hypothetical protein
MSTREDRVLTDVATAIGSTLGAVVAETDKITRFVKAKRRAVAKKARRAEGRAAKVRKEAKAGGRKLRAKVRGAGKAAKRKLRKATGRLKR